MTHDPVRLAILLSGGGTTFQNLLDRIADGRLRAEIVGVIASRADAFGVHRATQAGLPVKVVPWVKKEAVQSYGQNVWAALQPWQPDLVILAGWLHLLPVPDQYRYRILNIHPSLLPAFGGPGMYGRRVHEAVLAHGVKVSGCTVHFADDHYDTGPIILQKCVPVLEDDNAETLAARVFEAECEAYPQAIRMVAEGRVTVQGRRAHIKPASPVTP